MLGDDVEVARLSVSAPRCLRAARLVPLREIVAALLQRIDDTILEARAEAYWAATAYYGSLARMGDVDPQLEASMKPVIEFFAIGKRAPKVPPPVP